MAQTQQNCFLCAIDPHPCAISSLEGKLITAQERPLDGENVPVVTLRVGNTYASITLNRYYRDLLKSLRALDRPLATYHLTMRFYHLSPASHTSESRGHTVDHYQASIYTLAVLEPSVVMNITDLNQAEYCARQYLLGRLAPSASSTAALRGNLVHHCFKELLKAQDRVRHKRDPHQDDDEEPLTILRRHLERELAKSSIDMALLNTSADTMRAEVAPHLESLAGWFNQQRSTLWDLPVETDEEADSDISQRENMVRAETFLLAPEIGLRGRLDLLWQQNGRRRLLELKTGGATGALPRSSHKWQVHGYHALLTVRHESRMKKALATLLYSGTPQQAQDFGIPFSIRQLQQVNATRNILVLSHVTGTPPTPPGVSRCSKCAMRDQCQQVSDLLGWQPPQLPPESESDAIHAESSPLNNSRTATGATDDLTPAERTFFASFHRLLQKEEHEIEQQQALLWEMSVEERVARGTAISDLKPLGEAVLTDQGEWQQSFQCLNTSELREGDEILLSGGNPVAGEVVTGTILGVSSEQVAVWTPERIAHPTLLDRYDTSIVHVRTLQNLLRWLRTDAHLRGLVSGELRPLFSQQHVARRLDFNEAQNLAVTRALQMRDYLLIHGPPGTGKTSVIAEIVKRLCQQGQRVLLAAFTNQAVDNMLTRLDREGFHDYLRLGHERSVHEAVRPRLLQALSNPESADEAAKTTDEIRELLRTTPVIAATTATWSSDKYTPPPGEQQETGKEKALLDFDVALIDEAGQLTIPAILGALRFARRFILVGDEKQLPPLVLSKEASEQGLAESLFGQLKSRDEQALQMHPQEISACVPLRVQYRMHETISTFASRTFYRDQLRAHYAVARRKLSLLPSLPGTMPVNSAILQALRADLPMVFLDVRGQQSEAVTKMSNPEARAIREIVAGLLARGVEPDEIGIIAPYRAQVANLRRHLFSDDGLSGRSALPEDTPLSVDTVDRFQGGERPVIILSFATTTLPPAESQLREHLTNEHRLNVALTRAQRKLILVGNGGVLGELGIFKQLLAYCQGLHTVFSYSEEPSHSSSLQ